MEYPTRKKMSARGIKLDMLALRWKETPTDALFEKIVEELSAWIGNKAFRAANTFHTKEDLIAVGQGALLTSLRRWDPEQTAFSTFAMVYLPYCLKKYVERANGLIRVPAIEFQKGVRVYVSSVEPAGTQDGTFASDYRRELAQADFAPAVLEREQLSALLSRLTPEDATLLRARFLRGRTLEQIAADHVPPVSRERARQIIDSALKRAQTLAKNPLYQ